MGTLNRAAYERLIAEDIAWLEAQPRTLERDHVVAVLRDSARLYYGPRDDKRLHAREGLTSACGTCFVGVGRECLVDEPEPPTRSRSVGTRTNPEVARLEAALAAYRKADECRAKGPGDLTVEGCGDHSCAVRAPQGMGSNGGCRCDERTLRRAVQWYRRKVHQMDAALRELRDVATGLLPHLNRGSCPDAVVAISLTIRHHDRP